MAGEPAQPAEKKFAIWAQPLGLLLGTYPIRANLPLGKKASLGVELTYGQPTYGKVQKVQAYQALASVGPIFN